MGGAAGHSETDKTQPDLKNVFDLYSDMPVTGTLLGGQ
jgi:hypothetical protein